MKAPGSPGGGDLTAQDPEEEHTLGGEGEPAEEDDNEGQEDKLGPVQNSLDSGFKVTHLLPEANKLVNLDGDILDLVEKLDGDEGLETLRIPGNQLNVLNRVGIVNAMQFLGGFPLALLGTAIMEVKEPTIGGDESTFGQGGVTDTASVDGVLVFLVVHHRGGGITKEERGKGKKNRRERKEKKSKEKSKKIYEHAGSLLSLSALLVTTRRRHVPSITLSLLLKVVSTGSVGLGGIERGQVLLDLIIRVRALTGLVANTSNITRIVLTMLVLAKGVLGARLTAVPQTTPINLLDNNTPLHRGGRLTTIISGTLEPKGER